MIKFYIAISIINIILYIVFSKRVVNKENIRKVTILDCLVFLCETFLPIVHILGFIMLVYLAFCDDETLNRI